MGIMTNEPDLSTALRSMVYIRPRFVKDDGTLLYSSGTGVLVSPDTVFTVAHLLDDLGADQSISMHPGNSHNALRDSSRTPAEPCSASVPGSQVSESRGSSITPILLSLSSRPLSPSMETFCPSQSSTTCQIALLRMERSCHSLDYQTSLTARLARRFLMSWSRKCRTTLRTTPKLFSSSF